MVLLTRYGYEMMRVTSFTYTSVHTTSFPTMLPVVQRPSDCNLQVKIVTGRKRFETQISHYHGPIKLLYHVCLAIGEVEQRLLRTH